MIDYFSINLKQQQKNIHYHSQRIRANVNCAVCANQLEKIQIYYDRIVNPIECMHARTNSHIRKFVSVPCSGMKSISVSHYRVNKVLFCFQHSTIIWQKFLTACNNGFRNVCNMQYLDVYICTIVHGNAWARTRSFKLQRINTDIIIGVGRP